jgi:hypothetical protein
VDEQQATGAFLTLLGRVCYCCCTIFDVALLLCLLVVDFGLFRDDPHYTIFSCLDLCLGPHLNI